MTGWFLSLPSSRDKVRKALLLRGKSVPCGKLKQEKDIFMKSAIVFFVLIILLGGCSSSGDLQEQAPDSRSECPRSGKDLDSLRSEDQVIACFGKPEHETQKPDGRHTGLYRVTDEVTVVFLYDPDGNVIRYNAYRNKTR
ncbi:MAG: hypothetical protein CVV45_02975 [Spirochaetae bacterium HGW-Spirochaetae-10]|jgi:hypothetical protein|nr:MAG: hypothetical protein CVV45_02975 [Spirochaetae bacterium HGW-Spirochaetae-10]